MDLAKRLEQENVEMKREIEEGRRKHREEIREIREELIAMKAKNE